MLPSPRALKFLRHPSRGMRVLSDLSELDSLIKKSGMSDACSKFNLQLSS
jgi:hypothetical protein